MSTPTLIVLAVMVIVACIYFFLQKRNKKLINTRNTNVEQAVAVNDLVDLRIEFLATHDCLKTVSELVAQRIVSAIHMNADATKVNEVFQNLGLFSIEVNDFDTRENQLVGLIQQGIVRGTTPCDLKRYESVTGKKGFFSFKTILELSIHNTLNLMPHSLS